MSETKITLEQVIGLIKEAFGNTSPPKDENILLEHSECEYGGNKTAGLSGVRWIDFEERCYSKERDVYSWPYWFDLTPTAYHYYLPGYMTVAIKHPLNSNIDDVIDSLALDPPYNFIPAAQRKENFAFFTPQQKHAVKLFLEYVIQENPSEDVDDPGGLAKIALEQYWGKGQ